MIKKYYLFIFDENKNYYSANQEDDGTWVVSTSTTPKPIKSLPSNLEEEEIEFATNKEYKALVRSVGNSYSFVGDGAAILRYLYAFSNGDGTTGNGIEQFAYLLIMKWNPVVGIHKLEYTGRFAFDKKSDYPKLNTFTVPTVDDSAWGWISEFDTVEYAVPCNYTNPDCVKVLVDGVNLVNTVLLQTVKSDITTSNENTQSYLIPIVILNQSGDSIGVVYNGQEGTFFDIGNSYDTFVGRSIDLKGGIVTSVSKDITINIEGTFKIINYESTTYMGHAYTYRLGVSFLKVKDGVITYHVYDNQLSSYVYSETGNSPGSTQYSYINQNFTISKGESLFILTYSLFAISTSFSIIEANIQLSSITTTFPQIVPALRPLDLLKSLVKQATDGRYGVKSNYYSTNNKVVVTSGDSIRNVQDAKVYTTIKDWFKTYDSLDFIAIRNINGDIHIESFMDVYNALKDDGVTPNVILDLGECIDVVFEPALDYFYDQIEYGYTKKDYRHPSGTLAFNTLNTSSISILNSKNKLSLVSPYSADCYGILFLIMDYQGDSTQDNPDDKSNWILDITDELTSAEDPIGNFLPVNMDSSPTAPYIRYPFSGSDLYNSHSGSSLCFPTIYGVATPNTIVNVFVDEEYNGNCTSDSKGYWNYTIVESSKIGSIGLTPFELATTTGVHVIDVSFGDTPSILNPKNSITVNVKYGTDRAPLSILSHQDGNFYYDSAPLIRGTAEPNKTLVLIVSGSYHTVTSDGGGLWFFQCVEGNYLSSGNTSSAISFSGGSSSNASITIAYIDTGSLTININQSLGLMYPMPTSLGNKISTESIGSNWTNDLGFIECNSLPVINGVSVDTSAIHLYLSYIKYVTLDGIGNTLPGSPVTISPSGIYFNWNFQTFPVNYEDSSYPNPIQTILSPIKNGLSEISADTTNYIGSASNVPINYNNIKEVGLQLNRDLQHVEGVYDNTVFNTRITPKRNLINHYPLLASTLQQTHKVITFQTSKQNSNLITSNSDGSNRVVENADIHYGELGNPFCLPEIAKVTTAVPYTFNEIMYAFSRGGVITTSFRGTTLYLLPLGKMKQASVSAKVQTFELLVSSLNSFGNLLNLYKKGIQIEIMANSIYHSNANSLHMVRYDYTLEEKYQTPDLYDDLFENRNSFYPQVSKYIQKYNLSDGFKDQIVVNGVSGIVLKVYNVTSTIPVYSYTYTSVGTAPVPPPYYVKQVDINMSDFGEGDYYFVMCVDDVPALISEKVSVKSIWNRTILIESKNSLNSPDAFFSCGLVTVIRVEGLVKKYQPDIQKTTDRDIAGDTNLLYSLSSKKRIVRLGTAFGLPDYLYLKISDALLLDGLKVEGIAYTLGDDEEITPSEDVESHPMFYYDVKLTPKINQFGIQVGVGSTSGDEIGSVVVNFDSTAFGFAEGVTSIEIDS